LLLESAAKEATAEGRHVLCVLDDVWEAQHAHVLGTPLKAVTLLITTRVRGVVSALLEVHCSVMESDEAIALLLKSGGVTDPDSAALRVAGQAIEMCGRSLRTRPLRCALAHAVHVLWRQRAFPTHPLSATHRAGCRSPSRSRVGLFVRDLAIGPRHSCRCCGARTGR